MKVNINNPNLNDGSKLHPFSSSRTVRIQSVPGTDEYVANICNESNDGKFTWKEAGKNFLGGLLSPITNMFKSPKNFFIGAGCILAGAAVCALGGAPLLIGAGLLMGGYQACKAGYKMATAKDGDDMEKAFHDAGSATTTIGLSLLGAKFAKSANANTANANTTALATAEGSKGALATYITGAKAKVGAFASGTKTKYSGFTNSARAKINGWKSNFKAGSQNTNQRFLNWYNSFKQKQANNFKSGTKAGGSQKTSSGPKTGASKTQTGPKTTTSSTKTTFREFSTDHASRIQNARTARPTGRAFKNSTVKDPYEVLGVQKNATKVEIKAAYRDLANKFHPDKNPAGVETFKEISNANEILNNPELRTAADIMFP